MRQERALRLKLLAHSRKRSCKRSRTTAGALRPRLNRRCSWAERPGLGRRPAGDRAHAAGKRCHQRQSRPSVFRHHSSVGGREGACLAATGSWTACSLRIVHAELRRTKTVPGLGPAPRRSALRKNRRVPRAERVITTPCPFIDSLPRLTFELIEQIPGLK